MNTIAREIKSAAHGQTFASYWLSSINNLSNHNIMKHSVLAILLFSLLIFCSCQNKNKQIEKDTKAIEQVLKNYEKAAADGDVEAYIKLFSEDVVWAPPGSPVLRSKDEIKNRVQQLMGSIDFEFNQVPFEIFVEDDFAYVLSDVTGTFTHKNDGTKIHVRNTVLQILRKEKDGWKISRQIYNSKLPK